MSSVPYAKMCKCFFLQDNILIQNCWNYPNELKKPTFVAWGW
jgi:hypothetical protein